MITLPKLYAISDRSLANLSNVEIARQLIDGGARLIQLRDKEATAKELFDAAREILPLTRAVGGRLIINDRVDVALTAEADGVHLGQEDLTVEEAREILGPDRIIGISTHNRSQFEAALRTSADYIAVGPVFATTSKENPDPVVGLEMLREVRALTDRPIVAIGGIDHSKAAEVLAAGADCVAVISALYPWPEILDLNARPDIISSVRRLLEIVEPTGR
ncbi:MAG: thiamine phosphate synthase [Blastocatellia bacterium]|jgi:thiamine-phosphate pyrophosphorylase